MLLQAWFIAFFFFFCILTKSHFVQAKLRRRDAGQITSPSGTYAPVRTTCPQQFIQTGVDENGKARLSRGEQTYIQEKTAKAIPLWREYLKGVNLTEFDVEAFLSPAEQKGGRAAETLPNIGFALSGGGARALCFGAAIIDAFDGRNQRSNEAKIGGVLQLANYLVGVSGGNWFIGSWATSNFPSIRPLQEKVWRLTQDNDLWDWNIAKHYPTVYKQVKKKKKAGFPVSVVDAWGRLLSRHFIEDSLHHDSEQGEAVLWSSIRETSAYVNRIAPFVMSVATSRPEPMQDFRLDSPEYEFSAEDFSVYHPLINASMPIDLIGSPSPNTPSSTCVKGFDNAGFVMAISSNVFSIGDSPKKSPGRPKFFKLLDALFDSDDFEAKVPNTFKGLGCKPSAEKAEFQDNSREILLMADSGYIHKNVPLHSLTLPERKVDVIIVSDSTGDGQSLFQRSGDAFPNGTALYSPYMQTFLPGYQSYTLPKIPNSMDGTFAKLGYNKRPTFFGCNAQPETALIVYLPNYYSVANTAIVTAESTYTDAQINGFFDNGFAIAAQKGGTTVDPEWPQCLACALIERQIHRNSMRRTPQCQKCFMRYCAED